VQALKSSDWIGMERLKNETNHLVEAKKIIHEWILPDTKYASEYSLISSYLEDLRQTGSAIEEAVDFVFYDFLEKQSDA